MSHEEIQHLDDEERELMARLATLKREKQKLIDAENRRVMEENARKAEAARLEQLQQPVVIKVIAFTGAMVLTENRYREDIIAVMRDVPGRAYNHYNKQNSFPIGNWVQFVEKVTQLPNVSVEYTGTIREEMDWFLNAPVWEIEMTDKRFLCKSGPRSNPGKLQPIPGANWVTDKRMWEIPLPEGWRIWDKLQDVEGVVWSEDAQAFVMRQIERRASLDKIALMDRGEKFFDFAFDDNGVKKLRHFQEVGAEFIDAADGKALLADEMGLGKTWQALAYAVKNNLRTVVICPASLKPNWARQIRSLTNSRPTVYSGGEPSNHDLIKALTEPSKFSIINYDIVGRKVEHTKTRTDEEGFLHEEKQIRYLWVELINMSKPDLVIVDEGHYIKNVDSNRSQAVRKLKIPRIVFLTGTPVLNRPGELWPMLTMIAPDSFPAYETFLAQYTADGKYAKNIDELRTLLRSLMIRRLKRDVQPDLPPIERINEYHELSNKADKLYQRVLSGIYTQLAEYDAKGVSVEKQVTNILVQIQRLKQVCAIDKVDHTADLAQRLYDETDETSPRKVIIFSQYKAVAYAIYQRLADQGALCFVRRGAKEFVTADNVERDELVQQFQRDPYIKYLVVTEKTTKEGHDITAAGHVIFNDLFWTPAGHEQAEGRAYGRMDNPHSIGSYYMITDQDGESIDEWIMELLAKKLRIINQTVEGVDAERDVSLVMDIIERMRNTMFTRRKSA